MQKLLLLMGLSALITGCDALERNGDRLATNIGNGYDKTRYKISDYIYSREQQAPDALPAEHMPSQAYCYRLQADTVCYDQPVTAYSATLVGSQSGNTNYAQNSFMEATEVQATPQPLPAPEPVIVSESPSVAAVAQEASDAPKQLMSGF